MSYNVLIGIYTTIFILLFILCIVPRLFRKYWRMVTRQEWQLDLGEKGEFSTITTSISPPSTATSTLQCNNPDIHELLNVKFKFRSTRPHGRRRQRRDRGQSPTSSADPTTPGSHTPKSPHIYSKGENDSTYSELSHEDCLIGPEGSRQQKVVPVSESSFSIMPNLHSPQAPPANTQRQENDQESFIMHPMSRPFGQEGMEVSKTILTSEVDQCYSPSSKATCTYTTYPALSCFNGPLPTQTRFNCKCSCKKWYPGSHSEVNTFAASETSQRFLPLIKVTGKYTPPSVSTCFAGSLSPQTKMNYYEGHKMYPGSCISLPQNHKERGTLPKSVSHESFHLNRMTDRATSSLHTCFESIPPSQIKTSHSKPHKVYPGSCLVLPQILHNAVPKATSHEQFPPLHHHSPSPGSNPAHLDTALEESGISSGLWGVFKDRQRSYEYPKVSQDELNNIYDVPPSRILPVAALWHALQCEPGRGRGRGGGRERKCWV